MFMHKSVDAATLDTRYLTTFACMQVLDETFRCFSYGMPVKMPEMNEPMPEPFVGEQ